MNSLKRLLEPMKFSKMGYVLIIFGGFLGGIINLYFAWSSRFVIDAMKMGDIQTLLSWGKTLGVLYVGLFLYRYFTRWNSSVSGVKGYAGLKSYYLSELVKFDNTKYDTIGTGRLIAIMTSGVESRNGILLQSGFIAKTITVIVFSSFILASTNIYLFIYMIGILIFGWIVTYFLSERLSKARKALSDSISEYSRFLVRILMSKFEIMQSSKFAHEMSELESLKNSRIAIRKELMDIEFKISEIPGFFVDCLKFGLPLIAAGIFGNMNVGIGEIASIYLLIGYIDSAVIGAIGLYQKNMIQIQDVYKLRDTFDNTPRIKGYDTGATFQHKKGNILLQDINFSYGGSQIFQDFCLDITGGKRIALVGLSGAGKTTLMKLIIGYLRPDSGTVKIDNQDLMEVSLQSYYQHIGYLSQDPSVFDGTVRENLEYGIQDNILGGAHLSDIIRLAKCGRIYDLPQGLDTEIGERGVRLSGGQKQRLAIAKLMLKNPDIIFLDEPTSALDSFNEEQIAQALENLFKGRTVIIVAHRLQTVKHADRILYFEDGAVIEDGTHDELVKLGGNYTRMLALQSGF